MSSVAVRRAAEGSQAPPHHDPRGGFRNPWPTAVQRGSALRWFLERRRSALAPNPSPGELPRVAFEGLPEANGLDATWVGHATFLLRVGGVTLLTDPHFSERASPVTWAGPRRLGPPGLRIAELPHVDAVLLSHDHFDHLDRPTVHALAARFGDALAWLTPIGYRQWLARRGVRNVHELDWHESAMTGAATFTCLPAQHWTRRSPVGRSTRLWCSWAVQAGDRTAYFGGDSGWFPGYREIGERVGPIDLTILPIGAYAPRWFMKPMHMDPAEAVQAWLELGGTGILAGMHWGTFRLSDEHPLDPPARAAAAWQAARLPAERLWLPKLGETLRIA